MNSASPSRRRPGRSFRIGADIGGTFTDLVLLTTSGDQWTHKVLTTPKDPAVGLLQGIDELLGLANVPIGDGSVLIHGTTLVANAIIEGRGARTALVATAGFTDVLEIGREQRYDIYDLFLPFPEPLVPRPLRVGAVERLSRDGDVLVPLEPGRVLSDLGPLIDDGVASVAVCLLHSYSNPAHERALGAAIAEAYPQVSVSLSSDVAPVVGEFERMSTTVANAFVAPLMAGYLNRLEVEIRRRGFVGGLFLLQSSGGLLPPRASAELPIRLLESGAAGGASIAANVGRQTGIQDLIAFDMGGTTAKICVIEGGRPTLIQDTETARVERSKKGSGYPIRQAVIDLFEVGSGGGSIAGPSELGLLQVGPQSAGADPGPACYGLGGTSATVTDACLSLGYLGADSFLGGRMPLDVGRAEAVIEAVARRLGIRSNAAWGIFEVVCANMAAATRIHVVARGWDPRNLPLVATGGAGPIHAWRVAHALHSPEVIVPPSAGVASALGFLVAPATVELSRSLPCRLDAAPWDRITALYHDLEARVHEILAGSGVAASDLDTKRYAAMRLVGQFHDVEVPVPAGVLDPSAAGILAADFRRAYASRYPGATVDHELRAIDWRVRAVGPEPFAGKPSAAPDSGVATRPSAAVPVGRRPALFAPDVGFQTVPIYARLDLAAGDRLAGPAIIEEPTSTTVVPPGAAVWVDAHGNLRIHLGAGS